MALEEDGSPRSGIRRREHPPTASSPAAEQERSIRREPLSTRNCCLQKQQFLALGFSSPTSLHLARLPQLWVRLVYPGGRCFQFGNVRLQDVSQSLQPLPVSASRELLRPDGPGD